MMRTIGWQLKMSGSVTLLISSLAIAVSLISLLVNLLIGSKATTKNLLVELLRESNKSNQSLVHLIVSRDFQTYAGLQSLSQASLSQSPMTIHSPSSTSDYIPRDDATEANRIKAFGGQIGYGETIFEDDQNDEELKQALTEMVANGQIDFGEEGFH